MRNDGCRRCKLRLRGLELSRSICFECEGKIRANNEGLERAAKKCEHVRDLSDSDTVREVLNDLSCQIRALKETFDDPAPTVPE